MTTLFAFIIVLGILIFIHELGHFLFAKFNGVGVLKFSLGFGPSLVKKRVGETEYRISAIPLGGYVKMLGEGPAAEEEDLTPIDPEKSFAKKSLGARALIVAAGPVFNLLLAIVIYIIIGWTGIPTIPPVVGEVMEDTPAEAAGLMPGDRIVSIQGSLAQSWKTSRSSCRKARRARTSSSSSSGTAQISRSMRPVMIRTKPVREEIERPWIGISRSEEIVMKPLGFFRDRLRLFLRPGRSSSSPGSGMEDDRRTLNIRDSLGGPSSSPRSRAKHSGRHAPLLFHDRVCEHQPLSHQPAAHTGAGRRASAPLRHRGGDREAGRGETP